MEQKKESTYEGRRPAQYRITYYHLIPDGYDPKDKSKLMLDPTQRWVNAEDFEHYKKRAEDIINNPEGDNYAQLEPFGKPDCVSIGWVDRWYE
jgi:hypothetical protein